ncbi:MAG TPA: DUF4199 domain-containing protein [Gemmatimonadaceae bacterium]|nr:DUF4199 domain-containing protein [Gemmatimonadaceae bacterium]HRQ77178.1 DUF4199 domain-containing protein [Gemmatimonadaceae bacterium]
MRKIVLTFGLIAGAVMSLMLVLSLPFQEQLGSGLGMAVGYASMVLASLMIYFGVRQYREVECGGAIAFGQAFKVGMFISLIAIVCYVLTWEVVFTNFLPDFGEQYMAQMLERAREAGATAADLEAQAAEQAKFWETYKNNALVRMGFTALEPLPVVLVFSLASAGLLRTRGTASTQG